MLKVLKNSRLACETEISIAFAGLPQHRMEGREEKNRKQVIAGILADYNRDIDH